MPRNMFLFNNAIYLLPYTGVGSGITRALDENINVTFTNNASAQEFVTNCSSPIKKQDICKTTNFFTSNLLSRTGVKSAQHF